MKYIKVRWIHAFPDEPVALYSELDESRRETRKVEIFADGRAGFASVSESTPSTRTMLSTEPFPQLDEIAADPQFQPAEIDKAEFDKVWLNRGAKPLKG
jgi:hypothetical protein